MHSSGKIVRKDRMSRHQMPLILSSAYFCPWSSTFFVQRKTQFHRDRFLWLWRVIVTRKFVFTFLQIFTKIMQKLTYQFLDEKLWKCLCNESGSNMFAEWHGIENTLWIYFQNRIWQSKFQFGITRWSFVIVIDISMEFSWIGCNRCAHNGINNCGICSIVNVLIVCVIVLMSAHTCRSVPRFSNECSYANGNTYCDGRSVVLNSTVKPHVWMLAQRDWTYSIGKRVPIEKRCTIESFVLTC